MNTIRNVIANNIRLALYGTASGAAVLLLAGCSGGDSGGIGGSDDWS